MSIRKSIPVKLRQAGRRAYVSTGRLTAPIRMRPDFIIIGGQRCGTTSLFRALLQHPDALRPTFNKGVNYFDLNYARGPAWYAGHFPIRSRRTRSDRKEPVVFEASGYYMFHPFAISRLAQDLPKIKLVAMLRDPVERAYSAWKHESKRGYEWETFETALALEDQRLIGERDRMSRDISYESFCHRHHAYRRRGDYLPLLESILTVLPREQLHIIYSENFFRDPDSEFDQLCDAVGLARCAGLTFDRYNARPSASMPAGAKDRLTHYYSRQRQALEELVGTPAPWPAGTS